MYNHNIRSEVVKTKKGGYNGTGTIQQIPYSRILTEECERKERKGICNRIQNRISNRISIRIC